MTSATMINARPCDVLSRDDTVQIVLLRHAQAEIHGRFCGHSNPSLSVQGREQIPAIVECLSQIVPKAICTSDLRRAIETADPIARHFGLDYATSASLREMNFGAWEELTWKEVELQYPEDARAWAKLFPHHRPPGGESFLELQSRVVEELEQLAKYAESGCMLAVTHAGFIRTAVAWVLGVPSERISRISQDHGSLNVLEKIGDHWTVTALNLSAPRFANVRRIEGRP